MNPIRLKERICKGYYLILLIIAIVCFVWNYLSPEFLDDYAYKFLFTQNGKTIDLSHPIHTIGDAVLSQYNHYFVWNGRVIVHFFVQLFSGIWGKVFFDVCNSAILCVFVILLLRYIGKSHSILWMLFVLIGILLLPHFDETYLWLTGSIGYFWTGTAMLCFLSLYKEMEQIDLNRALFFPLFFIGLLLGWTHEGISFPLAVALGFVNLYKLFSTKRITMPFILAMGFIIGACLCAFSPATLTRSPMTNDNLAGMLIVKSFSFVRILSKLRIIYLLLILIFVLQYKRIYHFKDLIRDNVLLISAIIFSLGIVSVSGFETSRTAYGAELYSMLLFFSIASKYLKTNKHKEKSLTIMCSFVLLAFGFIQIKCVYQNYIESRNIVAQIKSNKSVIRTKEIHTPVSFMTEYVRKPLVYELQIMSKGLFNKAIAVAHRNSKTICFLPEQFVTKAESGVSALNEFNADTPYPFYAKRMKEDVKVNKIKVLLHPTNFATLPFWLRPFARHYGKYTATEYEESRFSIVKIGEWHYLLVLKNELLHDRVARLVLE